VPNQNQLEERAEVDLSEKVFTNSPNMLVLCLTVIGLTKSIRGLRKSRRWPTTFSPLFASVILLRRSALIWRCGAGNDRKD